MAPSPPQPTYESRATTHGTALGRKLLTLMSRKKTNLCISVDILSPSTILTLLDRIGPLICCAKTHIDTIPFTTTTIATSTTTPISIAEFTSALSALASKHSFLIFEDRKFADIGNTVVNQYAGGVYRIAEWSHITNAHTVPGPGIIAGLRKGVPEGEHEERGLLLLGEMSSAGTLSGGEYLQKTVQMARENRDFVMGFIAMGKVPASSEKEKEEKKEEEKEDWIVMTPGVNLGEKGDALGQQYKTPDLTIRVNGADVIIVGRGIVKAEDPVAEAERYRKAGWEAYERRCKE